VGGICDMKTKNLTQLALLGAIAIVFGYIESLFPIPLPIPGIKLGLGNIAVLVAIYIFNNKSAWFIMLIKVIVTSLLFATPLTLIYSLAGGILSLVIMIIMKHL
jgi:heptaprenyl diphosphate synthase